MGVDYRLGIKGNKFTRVEDVVEAVMASPLFVQEEIETGPEVFAPGFEIKGCWLFCNGIIYSITEARDFAQRSMMDFYGFIHVLEIESRGSAGPNWISHLQFINFLLSEDDGDAVLTRNSEEAILQRINGNLKLNWKYFNDSRSMEFISVSEDNLAKIFTMNYIFEDLV